MAPAVDAAALEVFVQFAFEAVQHVHDFPKSGRLQGLSRIYGALARTAQQHHRAVGMAALSPNLVHEGLWVGLHVGVLVPGDVHHAGRVADVEKLDFHAHIDEQRVRMVLQVLPGLPRGEMLHAQGLDGLSTIGR